MLKNSALLAGCIISLALLLVSCPAADRKTAVLCTDVPEFTSYVETFNASQDTYRIMISFVDTPRDTIQTNGKNQYDLVIDSYLNSIRYLPRLRSLESFFQEEQLERDLFYPTLLEQGVYNDQQVLLPISFNLPALVFKSNLNSEDQDSFMIELDELAERNRSFSVQTDKGLTRLGFSLRWNPEMLFLVTLLKDTNFHESETGTLLWNSGKLKESVDYIRTWTQDYNGGVSAEREFAQKFMVEPPYNLIAKERILCYYYDLAQFYSLPSQKREQLRIIWPSVDEQIPVLNDLLFAGIPQGAQGEKAARAFLLWFFNVKTQEELLKSTQYKRLRTFGIADGFSSMPDVNEQVLPRYYPDLVGLIPGPEYISFPSQLPPDWPLIKSEVLIPWLTEQANSDTTSELMREWLETWMRQRSPN